MDPPSQFWKIMIIRYWAGIREIPDGNTKRWHFLPFLETSKLFMICSMKLFSRPIRAFLELKFCDEDPFFQVSQKMKKTGTSRFPITKSLCYHYQVQSIVDIHAKKNFEIFQGWQGLFLISWQWNSVKNK